MLYAMDYSYSTSNVPKDKWAKNRSKVKSAFGSNVFDIRYEHKSDAEHLAGMIRRECGVNVRVIATHSVGVSVF